MKGELIASPFIIRAWHDTNFTGESPVTGIYRQV